MQCDRGYSWWWDRVGLDEAVELRSFHYLMDSKFGTRLGAGWHINFEKGFLGQSLVRAGTRLLEFLVEVMPALTASCW